MSEATTLAEPAAKPMRLWVCFNCMTRPHGTGQETKFASPLPVCPECKADGNDPRSNGCVAPGLTFHWDAPHAILQGRGVGYPACDPAKKIVNQRVTGEMSVVNCPACRASKAFVEAEGKAETNSPYHVPEVPVAG